MKQKQKRTSTRAPHGKPEHTRQVGAKVPDDLWRKFHQRGGSAWLRKVMRAA